MGALIEYFTSYARANVGRQVNVAALYGAALVMAALALGFALMAARSWLEIALRSAIEADLVISAVLVVIAFVVLLIAETVRRRPVPSVAAPVGLALAIPIAARIAPKLLNARLLGIVAVIAGGIVVGREFGKK